MFSKRLFIVIALAFGLAAIEVQYYLALFILCLFPCLFINFSNKMYEKRNTNQVLQKSTGYQVPEAQQLHLSSLGLGRGL